MTVADVPGGAWRKASLCDGVRRTEDNVKPTQIPLLYSARHPWKKEPMIFHEAVPPLQRRSMNVSCRQRQTSFLVDSCKNWSLRPERAHLRNDALRAARGDEPVGGDGDLHQESSAGAQERSRIMLLRSLLLRYCAHVSQTLPQNPQSTAASCVSTQQASCSTSSEKTFSELPANASESLPSTSTQVGTHGARSHEALSFPRSPRNIRHGRLSSPASFPLATFYGLLHEHPETGPTY